VAEEIQGKVMAFRRSGVDLEPPDPKSVLRAAGLTRRSTNEEQFLALMTAVGLRGAGRQARPAE